MRFWRLSIVLPAVGVFSACTGDDLGPNISGVNAIGIASVRVTPGLDTAFIADTVATSDQIQLSAVAYGRTGAPIGTLKFVWTSSNVAVAIVDEGGLVTPVSPGTAEISASAGKVGHATIVVVRAEKSLTVSPAVDTIFVDDPIVAAKDTVRFTAVARDRSGALLSGERFTWTSSSGTVAAIDAAGVAHAGTIGASTVTAHVGTLSATASLLVLSLVKSVTVTSPVTQALVGDTVQLVAKAFDYKNAPMVRSFVWTSSAPNVATVDSAGRAIFKTTGSASFTAQSAFQTSAATTVTALPRQLLAMDAGGDFSCGYTALGRGYCWGRGDVGQLASAADSVCVDDIAGQEACTLLPKRQGGTALELTVISAGDLFACGLASDRQPYCWGSGGDGEIGNGKLTGATTPTLATVKTNRFVAISAGGAHVCALNLVGVAYCWGRDIDGQLGDRLRVNSSTPIPVVDTTLTFSAISAGQSHTCAITTAGAAYCWGSDAAGQLGDGFLGTRDVPGPVTGGISFLAVSAGGRHTCGITSSGAAYCWGDNSAGQLGTGSPGANATSPALVAGGASFIAISAGDHHTCGITSTRAVMCWGGSDYGQVGDGNTLSHSVGAPVTVAGISSATSISTGRRHTCAIQSSDGQTYCWGSNMLGSLGNQYQAAVRATPQVVGTPR